MASVKFGSPYHKITGTEHDFFDVISVGQLCDAVIKKYGDEMSFLLGENNRLSKEILVLLDGKNAFIMGDSDAPIFENTKVVILPSISFA